MLEGRKAISVYLFICLFGLLFTGGLPDDVNVLTGGRFKSSLTGCISNVTVGEPAKLIDFGEKGKARGFDIKFCSHIKNLP